MDLSQTKLTRNNFSNIKKGPNVYESNQINMFEPLSQDRIDHMNSLLSQVNGYFVYQVLPK